MKTKLAFIIFCSSFLLLAGAGVFAQTSPTNKPDVGSDLPRFGNPLDNPKLSVSIPGFSGFRSIFCETSSDGQSQNCYVPWLADYIKALYNYGIGSVIILAVIVMMIGGVVWLTAGGNEQRIADAKQWINGSLLGILIAVSSYMVLNIINPALTELNPIKLASVGFEDLPEGEIWEKNNTEEPPEAIQNGYKPTKPSTDGSKFRERTVTEYIIVHTAAGIMTRDAVNKLHADQGWGGIGYNVYIERDGSAVQGRGDDKLGVHTRGWNSKSVGISYSGCAPKSGQKPNQKLSSAVSNETITQSQLNSLISEIKRLQTKYKVPRDKVIGHIEACNGCKACPCLDMNEIRKQINP